ncbi:uroporphyrinogen decarboxylase family protein [Candidatus Magnetobacterium casense]|uniref:Uroporphyrinogen decarboxylase family protein n=1 Tax=Candidatus Magnetobacterium casense TaxID=1455061 RepID=A0ABS6RV94_9BACT|nr:uroporphyrinogen decarboxylase family protein [Candidatus Magnetobacterium casensis]MBV6340193.1 uroporphyrinogen decarboxylase family protein [Candidatus Magnetobacterium casensis]
MSLFMTPMQRVLTTLRHEEPDRVPVFLLFTMHGAKELGMSVKEYFSKPENVAEGQVRVCRKFGNDCVYGFFYAPIEIEACGGEVIFRDDGPPNSGTPFIKKSEDIRGLVPPNVRESRCLGRALDAQRMMKEKVGGDVPIIGTVMSPFSIPVMQMGFDKYIELIYEHRELFNHLMKINEEFCIQWANAQLDAGCSAICYFDPMSSTTIIDKDLYLKTGHNIAQRTISGIKGPTATHFAAGRCYSIIEDVIQTGTTVVGVSVLDDLQKIKNTCKGRTTVMGNLNGIEMRRWSPEETTRAVKKAIASAGKGGGFILSDNHGEIPFQVPDDVLYTITEAVNTWGRYPLKWLDQGSVSE